MAGPAVKPPVPRLLLISDGLADPALPDKVEAGCRGGLPAFLLREPSLDHRRLQSLAIELLGLLMPRKVTFLIHARVELALTLPHAGCHLPGNGMPTRQARAILGPERLLGRSCHTSREMRVAFGEGADYVTLSPLFSTASHPGAPALGLEVFAQLCRQANGPCLALGGITADNAPQAIENGAHGVALIRAILENSDPESVTRHLCRRIIP
ncbi:MAG: thiamine phosphate synthase [Magnetococcales bacterium]|nr:thiamine phosphate synthase [Magnetococcales bacterium]